MIICSSELFKSWRVAARQFHGAPIAFWRVFYFEQVKLSRGPQQKAQMAQSGHSRHRNNLSARGQERTKPDFGPEMICPLMTRSGHWLCTAAMVLMPVSAPFE